MTLSRLPCLVAGAVHFHSNVGEQVGQGGSLAGSPKLLHLHHCAVIQPHNLLQGEDGQESMGEARRASRGEQAVALQPKLRLVARGSGGSSALIRAQSCLRRQTQTRASSKPVPSSAAAETAAVTDVASRRMRARLPHAAILGVQGAETREALSVWGPRREVQGKRSVLCFVGASEGVGWVLWEQERALTAL